MTLLASLIIKNELKKIIVHIQPTSTVVVKTEMRDKIKQSQN